MPPPRAPYARAMEASSRVPLGRCDPCGGGAATSPSRSTARSSPSCARYTVPGRAGTGPRTSSTFRGVISESQRRRPWAKPGAMCWVTKMGTGSSAGSAPRISASAGGPPVDATSPSASTRPCARRGSTRSAWERRRVTTGTSDIRQMESASRAPHGTSPSGDSPSGLGMTSSAPAFMARKHSACWSSATEATTRMREGDSAMMAAVAASPSSRGIRTSMVTTSGRSDRASATASTPSAAAPTTSMRPSRANSASSACRTACESSATSTRTRPFTPTPAAGRSPPAPPAAAARRRTPSWTGSRPRPPPSPPAAPGPRPARRPAPPGGRGCPARRAPRG
jgi:hypothetical protein